MNATCRAAMQHRVSLFCAAATVTFGLQAVSAHAQQTNSGNSIGPSEQLANPGSAAAQPTPSVEHLFGDWGGTRTYLGNLGIDIIVDATSEFAGNVSGGTKQASTFANQVGFEADLDLEKLVGIPGLSSHTVLVNRSGSNDSSAFGDNFVPVQEIYGAGGNTVVHFTYSYLEESLAGGRVDIAAGRMPVENDFSASPLNCNYMSNALCGNPHGLGGDIGFSSYPDSVWGGRVRVRPTSETYVEAGVYGVNSGLYNYKYYRSGFEASSFDFSKYIGEEFPVEIAYQPTIGPNALPGHYRVGFAWDNATFASVDGSPATHHGKLQEWALADQMILRNGPGDTSGLIALAGFTHGDPQTSADAEEYYVGLQAKGYIPNRPDDAINFLFSYDTISGQLGKAQAAALEFGGVRALQAEFGSGVSGIQTHEETIELNYDIHVYRGVNFQPEFQYILRPNAQSNIKDAAVFGFKTHVTF